MEAERLKKIEDIYHAALEIPSGERDFFFKKHCGEDENLRREVESLLSFDEISDNFLDRAPESLVAEMFAEKDKQTDLTGKKIGNYKIQKLLGKGGMGEVYLAKDISLNRQVALKFLPAELTRNADRLKRFEREAQTASGLNHPNIVTVHQFGADKENRFIVTEFVKGVTLGEKMAGSRLNINEVLGVAVQVAAALAAAHEAGIVHRDIKPENIMLRADGLVKILDFGLAKLIEQSENVLQNNSEDKTRAQVKTNPGVVMGTADYMSPEQACGMTVDVRTDVFSFGVMLFEMLTGETPFTGETVSHTIINILEKEMPPVSAKVKDCPAELEQIIRKTLAKKPDERFRTAAELLPDLKKLQRHLEFETEFKRTSQLKLSDDEKTQIFETGDEIPDLPPNNLTDNSSPIIGREKEIAEIQDLLKRENVSSLTMRNIGDEVLDATYADGHKLNLEEAIALAREDETRASTATFVSNKADTKDTNIVTGEALELQTQAFVADVSPSREISRSENFLANFRRRKIPVRKVVIVAVIILLLAAGAFFGYRNLMTNRQIESIAVMPFVNESGNADLDYLADGMTETLINSLMQIPNLNVKSRAAVFRYKDAKFDSQKIGETLNVQAILTGRIVQRGNQTTLNLELIDAHTENVLWSRDYERNNSEIVLLQSDIARDVSSNLKIRLSGAEEKSVAKTPTSDPDAYQSYLRGRYYWNRRTAENLMKAIEQFKIAADHDPSYALAYSGLADCYAVLPEYAATPASETIPQAKIFAERAIALDSNLAEPHVSLGMIYGKMWQWAEAEQEYKRAIALNPNYPTAYHWYSLLLRNLGRFDESAAMIRRAHELDPLSSIISINVSQVYQAQKNWNASIENTLKVIDLDPGYSGAYNNLGLAYINTGREREAVANFEKAVELSKRADVVLRNLGYAYAVVGRRAEALAIAKELEERFAKKSSIGIYVATVYAGLGDKDKVFEWLEKDFQNKEDIATIRWSPQLESVADDPRFKDLLKRMNLPE